MEQEAHRLETARLGAERRTAGRCEVCNQVLADHLDDGPMICAHSHRERWARYMRTQSVHVE